MIEIYPLQVLLFTLAGYVNRRQQAVVEYLIEENRVLKGAPRRTADRSGLGGNYARTMEDRTPSTLIMGAWGLAAREWSTSIHAPTP